MSPQMTNELFISLESEMGFIRIMDKKEISGQIFRGYRNENHRFERLVDIRHTDDVLGNAWSCTSAFVCRDFLVRMP